MAITVALWSIALKPGQPETIIPQSDLRITNAALSEALKDASSRTTVKITYELPIDAEDDEEETDAMTSTILCSLTPGKIEQCTVDIVLDQDSNYLFEVVGKNTIYLTGNYIDQMPPPSGPFDEDSDEDSEEGAFRLEDVSSDVEMHPDDLDGLEDAARFDEVDDDKDEADEEAEAKAKKSTKRPRESDATDAVGTEEKLSKSQKKKLSKKQKDENGQAIPSGVESDAKGSGEQEKKEKEKNGKASKVSKILPGGVKVLDAKIGTGPQAKKGNTVSLRYIGKLQTGKVFDSNTKGKPFTFHLGKGEVIKGWDEGIVGMQIGGERVLTIPPKMAYGNKATGDIPAGSTLIFECKLLEIK